MNFLICRPRERIFPESSGAIEWGEVPEAPFAAGTQVGTIIYTLGEKKIGQMPIVTKTGAQKAGYFIWLMRSLERLYI